jgi:hypothetical protein
MRKSLIVVTLLFAIPLMVQAAHALIWLFDDHDMFIDPQVGGDTIDCAYWIEQTLVDNGHTYDIETYLPFDLSPYDVVFVTLGFFRC